MSKVKNHCQCMTCGLHGDFSIPRIFVSMTQCTACFDITKAIDRTVSKNVSIAEDGMVGRGNISSVIASCYDCKLLFYKYTSYDLFCDACSTLATSLTAVMKHRNEARFSSGPPPSHPMITCECAREKFNFMFHERWCPDWKHAFDVACAVEEPKPDYRTVLDKAGAIGRLMINEVEVTGPSPTKL